MNPADPLTPHTKKSSNRLVSSIGHSLRGFRHAVVNERAVQQVTIALLVLVPLSTLLPVSNLEHLLLVLSVMLIVLVELMNSAVETTLDRVSTELHELSKRAKDMASAAVFVAVLMAGLTWAVIAGPLLVKLIRA